MNTKQIIDEMEKELLQYSSGGYSGGKDGLRCFECDRKYSGEASYGQLCAVCNFHSYTRTLLESFGEEIIALFSLPKTDDKELEQALKDMPGVEQVIRLKMKEIIEEVGK